MLVGVLIVLNYVWVYVCVCLCLYLYRRWDIVMRMRAALKRRGVHGIRELSVVFRCVCWFVDDSVASNLFRFCIVGRCL